MTNEEAARLRRLVSDLCRRDEWWVENRDALVAGLLAQGQRADSAEARLSSIEPRLVSLEAALDDAREALRRIRDESSTSHAFDPEPCVAVSPDACSWCIAAAALH